MLTEVVNCLKTGSHPLRIVCFGDSITGIYYHTGGRRAWGDLLQAALQRIYPHAQLELHNAGVSGNTTEAALARLDRDVLAHQPHLVLVMFGMNDCRNLNPTIFRENLTTIVQRCRDTGAAVILCTQNSIYPDDETRFANLPVCTDIIRALATELAVPLADCYQAYEMLRAADPLAWQLLMSETIHPCLNGHQVFAQVIAATIARSGAADSDSGSWQLQDGARGPAWACPPEASPNNAGASGKIAGPAAGLSFVFERLRLQQPVHLICMAPVETIVPQVLRNLDATAKLKVTQWPVGSLTDLESWAKSIRTIKPDMVVIAVPAQAQAPDSQTFIRSYNWILNWSIAQHRAQWDTIAILPAVLEEKLSDSAKHCSEIAQQVIAGKDISWIIRRPGDESTPQALLQCWFDAQHQVWHARQAGITTASSRNS